MTEAKKFLIQKYMLREHKNIFNNFDLGSPLTIVITFYNNNIIITNSNKRVWGEWVEREEVGEKLAETVLLHGLECDKITWGDWLHNSALIQPKEVEKLEDTSFYYDVEMLKLWTCARLLCNSEAPKDKVFTLVYYDNYFSFNEFSKTEYIKMVKEQEQEEEEE